MHLKKHNVACEETYRNKMLVELLYDRNIAFIGRYKMVREMTREEARKFKEERCTFLDYNGDFLPGSPVEHFILKASEKTFTGGVVRRTSLFGH